MRSFIAAVVLATFVFVNIECQGNATTTATAPNATSSSPTSGGNCSNTRLDDATRKKFLDTHNNFRSAIAKGQTVRNGQMGLAPPASLMYKLVYDCNAESNAQQHANSCPRQVLAQSGRPGYKENIYVDRSASTPMQAADNAMSTWWSQLATNGIRSDMLFTQAIRSRTNNPVTQFTKQWYVYEDVRSCSSCGQQAPQMIDVARTMAWGTNRRLGCAVNSCRGFRVVVCMYSPGGNNVGENVYDVGPVCSKCPVGCADGLCPQ